MSESKYHFKREGNHFKVTSAREVTTQSTQNETLVPKLAKRSIWSRINSFFGIVFSGIIMIFGFLIATPFFILSVLINWIKFSIGFAIFWTIIYIVYDSIILNNTSLGVQPFNNKVILTIMALGLVASVFLTIAEAKD
ncbi:lactose transporter [Streptococcus rifensis]